MIWCTSSCALNPILGILRIFFETWSISSTFETWVEVVFESNSKPIGIALPHHLSLSLLVLRFHGAFMVSFTFVTQSSKTWTTFTYLITKMWTSKTWISETWTFETWISKTWTSKTWTSKVLMSKTWGFGTWTSKMLTFENCKIFI